MWLKAILLVMKKRPPQWWIGNPVTPITMDPIITDPMSVPRMNSATYYCRGGEKVQRNETLIIFPGKRYGSVVVHSQS
jgi:hypothetical protein